MSYTATNSHSTTVRGCILFRDDNEAFTMTKPQRRRAEPEQIEPDNKQQARTQLCSWVRGELRRVPVSDVYYFFANNKYVSVRYPGGEILIEDSLKSLEQEFGDRFVRIHRNALVSRERLAGLEKGPGGGHVAHIEGIEDRLEISRRHLPAVRRILQAPR